MMQNWASSGMLASHIVQRIGRLLLYDTLADWYYSKLHLDFLWGHPTEVLIKTLVPRELAFAQRRVRLVQIGEMAGPTISLPADALRTSGLEICGGGAGISPEA